RTSYFGKWTVNLNLAYRDRFYLLKPLIKVFIKAGVLSDLGSTVDYPKKLMLGSIFKTSRSNEIGPRFAKTGAE
ncbi:MAG: hypothetical protein PUF58_02660, partial [Collinsella sp.]|nr:hypothetical protein [Collinsella sp.]